MRWNVQSANGRSRVIALIDDPAAVRRILEHLGCAAPDRTTRGPPVQPPERSDLAGNEFDDIVTWLAVGNLVSRMVLGGQLP